jgi:hypothetical protein
VLERVDKDPDEFFEYLQEKKTKTLSLEQLCFGRN